MRAHDADPGELVAADARAAALFASGSLGTFIAPPARYTAATPRGATRRSRHTDHAEAHADGGPTSADNGQGLCEACNHAKQAPAWQARSSPEGDGHQVVTVTPTGHVYGSAPPVLVTIRETPIRLDYVLAG